MKKLMMAVVLGAAMTAGAEMKVGTVEMMKLIRSHPSYDSNRKVLADTEKDYQAKLEAARDEIKALQEQGTKEAEQLRNPMLKDSAKAAIEKKLVELQNKFITMQQNLRNESMRSEQELAALEQRLLKTTTDEIRAKFVDWAEAHGYDFIFDSNAVPFQKKGYDLTDTLIAEFGYKGSKIDAGAAKVTAPAGKDAEQEFAADESEVKPAMKPAAKPAEPVAKPVVEEAKPEVKPAVEEAKPEVKPVVEEAKPEAKPVAEEAKPAVEEAKSEVKPEAKPEVKPVVEEAKPVAKEAKSEVKPVVEEAKPEVKPAAEEPKPAAPKAEEDDDEEVPVGTSMKPAVKPAVKPAGNKEDGAADNAPAKENEGK